MASSAAAASFAAVRSSVAARLAPLLRTARAQSQSAWASARMASAQGAKRWGAAAVIGLTVLQVAVAPEVRERAWLNAVARLDPVREWHHDRTHGRRKRTLLAHFGVARGGDVLELLPGASGVFPALEVLSNPEMARGAHSLQWRGIDTHSTHWKAGRLQRSAGSHAGVPESQLLFDSCAARDTTFIQLLRETPEASVQNVLALHGLSSLFTASPLLHASVATSASASPSSPEAQRELQAILAEIYRILKPGGRFIFIDQGAYPRSSLSRNEQDLTTLLSVTGRAHPAGHTTPIEIAQTLPVAGFVDAHLEQWPEWVDPRNHRKGIRALRCLEVDGVVELDGLRGSHPIVAGVATKSINAPNNAPLPGSMLPLQAAEGNLGNVFRGR